MKTGGEATHTGARGRAKCKVPVKAGGQGGAPEGTGLQGDSASSEKGQERSGQAHTEAERVTPIGRLFLTQQGVSKEREGESEVSEKSVQEKEWGRDTMT